MIMTFSPLSYATAFYWRPATSARGRSLNLQLARLCFADALRSPWQLTPGTAWADYQVAVALPEAPLGGRCGPSSIASSTRASLYHKAPYLIRTYAPRSQEQMKTLTQSGPQQGVTAVWWTTAARPGCS